MLIPKQSSRYPYPEIDERNCQVLRTSPPRISNWRVSSGRVHIWEGIFCPGTYFEGYPLTVVTFSDTRTGICDTSDRERCILLLFDPFCFPSLLLVCLSFLLLFLSSLCVAPCMCIFCSLCPTCCNQLTSFEVNHPQHAPTPTSCKLLPFLACSFGWVVYVVAMGGLHVPSWRWIPMLGFCWEEQLLACSGYGECTVQFILLGSKQEGALLCFALDFVGGCFQRWLCGRCEFSLPHVVASIWLVAWRVRLLDFLLMTLLWP